MVKIKNKENLAIATLVGEMPEIVKVLKDSGQEIGKDWIAPRSIASLAMMKKLNEKGVTFDLVAETLATCLVATTAMTKKISRDEEEIVLVDDFKTRLAGVKLFANLMGIEKGMSLPLPPSSFSDDKPSTITVRFKDEGDKVDN